MRKISINFIVLFTAFSSLAGCIKQLDKRYTNASVAEIDAAVLNANAAGLTYPIITRHPRPGIPISTTNSATSCEIPQADSTIRRISKEIRLRINLIGAQSSQDQTVGYKVITTSPITSIAFPATVAAVTTSSTCTNPNAVFAAQTPSAVAATLNVSSSVAGTHFRTLSGVINIPANSSFGYLTIPLLSGTATAGSACYIGIQLDSTGTVLPAVNLRTIGLVVDQR